jgi:plasmid stability protein
MSKMIQIRNVPDWLHRKLKARAAEAGMSLSDYLIQELKRDAERPSVAEFRAMLATRTPIDPSVSPAQMIRELRGS